MTAASEPDILAGVERWARVRGFNRGHAQGVLWHCGLHAFGNFTIYVPNSFSTPTWSVAPAIALAWALLVETDAGPVDVGRCPACVARGGPMEWEQRDFGSDAKWSTGS
jgi:hypothetical protein